jgi:hypothetical protein
LVLTAGEIPGELIPAHSVSNVVTALDVMIVCHMRNVYIQIENAQRKRLQAPHWVHLSVHHQLLAEYNRGCVLKK